MVCDEELCDENVAIIANAFSLFLTKRNINRVIVGYDNRVYSEKFYEIVIETLTGNGLEVIAVGLTLSPVVYFSQYHYNCPGAIMITASHNPDGWSGFKLSAGFSATLNKAEIDELYALCDFGGKKPDIRGSVQYINVRDAYIDNIVSRIKLDRECVPKLVIDAGNGGAGVFAYEIFQRIGCMVFQLNCDPDYTYPHYFPNPSDLTARKQLRSMVLHPYIKADIGISFDGDGDRIGVLNEKGNDVWADKLLLLLSKQLLGKKKGAKIVFDVKCTQALTEFISGNGGVPLVSETGHSYIKARMKSEGADLGGERSGHIYIGGDEYWGFDDALFAAAKIVEFVSNENKPISEIINEFPHYHTTSEISANCPDSEKYNVVKRFASDLKSMFPQNKTTEINGIKMFFDAGWGLVRASSNMPALSIVFEAKTRSSLENIYNLFHGILSNYPEIDSNWGNVTIN